MKKRSCAVPALAGSIGVLVLIVLCGAKSTAAYPQPASFVPIVAAPLASSCVYSLPDGMCAYHGDLHSHTGYSDGQGTPQQAFTMARANGLDFFAVTDHAEFLTDDEWDDILTQAQTATVEGQFIGLRGFEWSSFHSHLNVFATDDRVGANDPLYDGLDEFYAWLSEPAQVNALAQFNHPYHPPGAFDDLRYDALADLHIYAIEVHTGDALRTVEYKQALQSGWHVAPTNNSDTHQPNWGERRGRTGILAPRLTYYHVINALRTRRVFATQDENLALALRVNDYWMGSVFPQGPIFFDVYASDPDPGDTFTSLELYRNGNLFKGTAVNSPTFAWRFALPGLPAPGTWWYVKATQSDGDQAYTSPIWVRQPKAYDVLVRDNVGDVGDVPSTDPSWQSPDVWVRRQADDQIWHQNPVAGETNYVYARVQNVGANPINDVYVSFYWATPSLGLVWPENWHPINATPVHVPHLSSGGATEVSVPWLVPTSAPEHSCLLVRLWSAQDPIRSQRYAKWHNNVGQRNVHVVDLSQSGPGTLVLQDLVFYLANPFDEQKAARLLISDKDLPDQGVIVLHLKAELFDRWMASELGGVVQGALVDPVARVITLTHPVDAVVYGLPLQAGEHSTATLALAVPNTSTLALQVIERMDGAEVGGNLYTSPSSRRPNKIELVAAEERLLIEHSTVLTATVVGQGFVPVADGTQVHFTTTLGGLSSATAHTQNGLVTVTLTAATSPGTAIVRASAGHAATAAAAVDVYRTCWVRLNDETTDYTTVQAAVDASTHPTDVVKVAGRCAEVNQRGGRAQVAHISKTLTVRGGYTTTNWSTPDPAWRPTTLDARQAGRVLYVTGGAVRLEGLYVTGGSAEGLGGGPSGRDAGGGLYVTSATLTLRGNRVFSNSAALGGGLYLSSGDAMLINSLLHDNQGAGLYVAGSLARLWHTTLARNDSGVYVTGRGDEYSTVALTNTILVSHTLGITVAAGNTATLQATLWGSAAWANGADWGGSGLVVTGTRNYWGDPAFITGSVAANYHIGPGSAALDAGVPAGVQDDVDGDPRPLGRGYDLGADELRIELLVTKRAGADPAEAGAQLAYTLYITNAGNFDLHATVTDRLPAHVTPGGTLTWTPTIKALGGVWTQRVVVTTERYYAGVLTNVVQVTTDEGATGIYTVTSSVFARHDVYLPLLTRNLGPPEFCAPQLVAQINTGPQPHGVALDAAGRRAFVAHAGGLTVINADSLAVLTRTQTFTSAQGVAYDADRDRIWIARRDPDRVLVLDGATYASLADLPAGGGALGVAYNPANDRVYVSNFFSWTVGVYDAETLTHLENLTDFAEPAHLAVNPVTNKVYVVNHWPYNHVTAVDGVTHDSHRIQTGLLDGYGVAVDATRNLIYATAIAQGRVVVIDGATETQLGYLDVKRGSGATVPLRVIAVNPDAGPEGHLWLISSSEDGGSDQLLLIPNGWPTLGTPVPLDVAPYPLDGIVYDPGSDQVWVTSVGSGSVSVVQDGEPVCDVPFSTAVERESLFWLQTFPQP